MRVQGLTIEINIQIKRNKITKKRRKHILET